MPYLEKTTVYLVESDYQRLKELARKHNRPAAELVREAVTEYVRCHSPQAKPKSLGAGKSGRSDLSEKAEELLDGIGR